jgi:hypothetical protein
MINKEPEKVRIKFTPKQKEAEAIALQNNITLYGGAIRGGKSIWLILMFVKLAMQYEKSRWVIIRKSETNLHKTTLVSWRKCLDMGVSYLIKEWSAGLMTATFINDSQILFMAESYDADKDLNRFRGLEVNGGGFDEINECQQTTLNKLIERTGSNVSVDAPRIVLATCNPTHGWVKDVFYDPYIAGTLRKGWAYVPAKVTDNPHVPQGYVDDLRENLPWYEYQAMVEGDWEVTPRTGGEFFHAFDPDIHVDEIDYDTGKEIILGFDTNRLPYPTCVEFQLHGEKDNRTLVQIGETCPGPPRNNTESLAKLVAAKYKGHRGKIILTGDREAHTEGKKFEGEENHIRIWQRVFADNDLNLVSKVQTSNPSVALSGDWMNSFMSLDKEGKYTPIRLRLNKSAKETVKDFMLVKMDADGTMMKNKSKDKNGATIEALGHTADATRYACLTVFAEYWEAYQRGGPKPKPIVGIRRTGSVRL